MRLLVSWQAYDNDFEQTDGRRNIPVAGGPTHEFHSFHYKEYDKHVVLSTERNTEARFEGLLQFLRSEFPSHQIEPLYLNISDPLDLEEVYAKISDLLLSWRDDQIDIFCSPGTWAMHVAWFIGHSQLDLQTRLLQLRHDKHKGPKGAPKLMEINVEKSDAFLAAVIRQNEVDGKYKKSKNKITSSIQPVYDRAKGIAQTDRVGVLILGESGTGKEDLAHYIHQQSVRRDKPFQAINCSAFGDSLLESRLFGYKKGAFTGALADTKGLIAESDGGTVFLDEIGDISPYMQQLLLRVIQEKEVHPMQGKPVKVDVRFIAATNRNLVELCKENKFRSDLYYRLCVVELELPNLQERGEKDIDEMIQHFLSTKATELKKTKLKLDDGALALLRAYPYPGNIRELENIIAHLYVFCNKTATAADLPKRMLQYGRAQSAAKPLDRAESEVIEETLRNLKGNKTKTAKQLGISVNTLKTRMEKYRIK